MNTPSSPRALLKRGRSSITDDEAKPTVSRPERKKLKVMAIGKLPSPSAQKRRLHQLFHRQKKTAVPKFGHPLKKGGLDVVSSASSAEGPNPVADSALPVVATEEVPACEGLGLAAVADTQRACQSRNSIAPNLTFATDTPEATPTEHLEDLKSNVIPLLGSSDYSQSESGAPGNLQKAPRRAHHLLKLRKRCWHPYSTGIGKPKHEDRKGGLKSQGPPIESKESLVIQIDMPSSRPTTHRSEETSTPMDSAPAHLPYPGGQVRHHECEPSGSELSALHTVDAAGFSQFQGVAATEPSVPKLRIASVSPNPSMEYTAPPLSPRDEPTSSAVAHLRADSPGLEASLSAMLIDDVCKSSRFCLSDTVALPIPDPLPPYLLGLPGQLEMSSFEHNNNKKGGFPDTQLQDASFHTNEMSTTIPSSGDLRMEYNGEVPDENSLATATTAGPDLPPHPDDLMAIVPVEAPGPRVLSSEPRPVAAELPSLLLDSQTIDLVDLNSPADVFSEFVLNLQTSPLLFNDPDPFPPMNSSIPILPAEPSKLGGVTSPQTSLGTIQVAEVSRSKDIPQPAGILHPSSALLHEAQLREPHPANICRPGEGTDAQCMDVDVDMLGSGDFNGYANALDEDQLTPGQILKSPPRRHLKSLPDNCCCSATMTKIMELLAKPKSSNPRLPKSLRERGGQPRQYDVPSENNQLKTCVREYAHHLLGQMPWGVPSEGEILAFEDGRGTGPTVMSFRLALASQGLASRWNAQAADIFADAFLSEDELAREFSDREAVLSAFIVHLITLQKRYRQPILREKMTEAEINGERDKQKEKAREQRKRGLFRRRTNVTKDYDADHLLRTLIASFWSYCTPDVMSDDETDSEWDGPADQVPHFVKITNWRNPDIINFFRVLDALYFSTRFKVDKWSPGRFPHTRVPSLRLKVCDAVPGLPVTFYRPQWLSELSDIERRKLKTRPAIDLDFSQNILRIAARFLHIRHRKQCPLPRDHPALLDITTSTFPSGFPLENILDDQSRQAPNEEVLMTRSIDLNIPQLNLSNVPDKLQQTSTTSHLSQPIQDSLPLPQESGSQFTTPALTMEPPAHLSHTPYTALHPSLSASPDIMRLVVPSQFPILPHTPLKDGILLCPVSPAPRVEFPGGNFSRPQLFLLNQTIEGSSRSYMVEAVAPAGSGSNQPRGTQSLVPNAGLTMCDADQKRPVPFILRKRRGALSMKRNGS